MTFEETTQVMADVRRLVADHDFAMTLLADIVTTFRLPANRFEIARKMPELERVIDPIILRYARYFEKRGTK